jgi:hypothetical protein
LREIVERRSGKRRREQSRGIDRVERRPQDVVEIVAKPGERTGQ